MMNENINIVLPPVWSGVYLNTARLIKYSLEDLEIDATIVEAGENQDSKLSIVLGWNLIPEQIILNHPYIIYQLEPLILPMWKDKIVQKKSMFQNALSIWDYSEANTIYLKELGFKSDIVPLGYHQKLEDVSLCEFPDYDVLFVGFLTERRKKIIEELQQHCCISIQPRWGKDFSEALGRSKILLNLHQYDALNPLEQPRIAYALNNRCFVISENSADDPYPHLVTSTYGHIVDTILHFLKTPYEREKRKKAIFEKFEELRMESIIKTQLANLSYASGFNNNLLTNSG